MSTVIVISINTGMSTVIVTSINTGMSTVIVTSQYKYSYVNTDLVDIAVLVLAGNYEC
jgi:urease beta subunit